MGFVTVKHRVGCISAGVVAVSGFNLESWSMIPDKRITKLIGRKIDNLSKVCSSRVIDIVDQLEDEKRKKVRTAIQKFKIKSEVWTSKNMKRRAKMQKEVDQRKRFWVTSSGESNSKKIQELEKSIDQIDKELRSNE